MKTNKTKAILEVTLYFKQGLSKKQKYKIMEDILNKYPIQRCLNYEKIK